jgi:hypothetical protein
VFSGRGTISLSHEVTKAGASAFVEKEQGFSTIVDAVARLVSEAAPIQSIDSASPVRTLAQHGDLPRLTVVALQDIERHLRTLALSGYSPTQLLHDLAAARHKLPSHVEDKLAPLQTFAKESRLSFGDLFDLTIGIATAQLRPSPPPKQLRALKDMLVPIRNDLFHGREVRDRTLLTALLAAQDCLEQFDSLE